MTTKKKEIMVFGKDQWEIVYERLSVVCGVRVEVRFIRSNRKWYQSRYLIRDFGYWLADHTRKMDEKELCEYASHLIEKFYCSVKQCENLDNFFREQ